MEKGNVESGTTERPPAYVTQAPTVVVKNRKKTAAIVGSVVACTVVIAITVVLSFHYLRATVKEKKPQTFNINVKNGDKQDTDKVSVDPKKQQLTIKYQKTEDGRDTIALEDIKNGFMAVKETSQDKTVCLVSPIANRSEKIDFDKAYEAIEKAKENGASEMNDREPDKMEVLTNHTIHPVVLRYTAGDAIYEFCSKAESYWLIEKQDDDTSSGDRQKRAIRCYRRLYVRLVCCPWRWYRYYRTYCYYY